MIRQRSLACTVCLLLLLTCAATPARAFDYAGADFEVGARALVWMPTISGDVRFDLRHVPPVKGTTLDLSDDLDVDDELIFGGEAFVGVGRHKALFRYTSYEYTSEPVLTSRVMYYGEDFPAGKKVYHTLEWEQVDLEYLYKAVEMDTVLAGLSLDLMVRLKHIEGSGRMIYKNQVLYPCFSQLIPSVGGGFRLNVLGDYVQCGAHATWIEWPENRTMEFSAEVSAGFWLFSAQAGYRWMILDVEAGNSYLDLDLMGPYATLTVAF